MRKRVSDLHGADVFLWCGRPVHYELGRAMSPRAGSRRVWWQLTVIEQDGTQHRLFYEPSEFVTLVE